MITQEKLKEVLHYNPNTGLFKWRIGFRNQINAGDIAGTKMGKKGNYYISIGIEGKYYLAHRLAWLYMTGSFPSNEIDHKLGNGLDNKWEGIRASTRSQNCENRKLFKNSTTGITGVNVCIDRRCNNDLLRYTSVISIDGKPKQLYKGKDFFEACCVRRSAENNRGYLNFQR